MLAVKAQGPEMIAKDPILKSKNKARQVVCTGARDSRIPRAC